MGSTTEPAPKLSSSFVGEMLPDDFPVGLKVLVVDDDLKYLKIVEQMLKTCSYQVTTCSKTTDALKILRERKCCFDVVITEVHMPDIDGFKLVEFIGKENGVPVIMMSADEKTSTVARGIMHGVCDYLIKPIRIEELRSIWQHVIRKKWHENSDVGKMQKEAIKGENEEDSDSDGDSSSKKPRLVWSLELHQRFVGAVNQIGIEKAVPRKILDLMNVPGLTRENVASHLQKYRLYLRRSSGMDEKQAGTLNVGRNMGFEQPIADYSTLVPYQPSQSHVPVQNIRRGFDRLLPNSVKTMESSGNLGVSYPSGLLQPQLYQSALLKSNHAANVQSSFVMGFLHSPNNGHLRNLSIPLSQSHTSSFSNLLDKKLISSQSQTVMGLGQASDASSRNKGVLDGYIVPGSVSSLSSFSGRADYISHLQIKSSTMNSNVVPRFEGPNIRGPNGVLTLNRDDSSNQVVPDRKREFVGNGATLPSRFAIEDFDPRDIQKHGKTFGKIDKEG